MHDFFIPTSSEAAAGGVYGTCLMIWKLSPVLSESEEEKTTEKDLEKSLADFIEEKEKPSTFYVFLPRFLTILSSKPLYVASRRLLRALADVDVVRF